MALFPVYCLLLACELLTNQVIIVTNQAMRSIILDPITWNGHRVQYCPEVLEYHSILLQNVIGSLV